MGLRVTKKLRERLQRQGYSDTDIERLRELYAAADKARDFPRNTCGASRHLHMMAEDLIVNGRYTMFDSDPAHCAESILAVLQSVWTERRALPIHPYKEK